jgi:hypothetical protein
MVRLLEGWTHGINITYVLHIEGRQRLAPISFSSNAHRWAVILFEFGPNGADSAKFDLGHRRLLIQASCINS